MTQLTDNYSLIIYESTDTADSFLKFRGDIAGVGAASNMKLIDTALGDLQDEIDVLKTQKEIVYLQVIRATVDIYLGDGAMFFSIPPEVNTFKIIGIEGYVYTVSSSGNVLVQLHNISTSQDVLSTPLRIDQGGFNSLASSARPVINTAQNTVLSGNIFRIDIDSIGTGVKGLDISLSLEL